MSDHLKTPPGKEKETKIYVNTKDIIWNKKEISFEELVNIVFPSSTQKEFDVTYLKGQSNQEGELINGQSIHVHPEMEFLVTPTNES
ncbi:MAG: multiubiquitin domain-containing protein [Bacteroidales bacterium]|nr:multiubiquitin domain-containing protein [Bacteroidales bacterium]